MPQKPVTVSVLRAMKRAGEKIAVLTCYDASFATLLEGAGVDVMLVGDSLGMVVQGRNTTVPVSVDDMVYHTRMVARGSAHALLVADLPFLAAATPERALASAQRLMQDGQAQMVKLEGGAEIVDTVALLTRAGVPVCGHLGLLPQSIHKLGGYRVQGRDEAGAQRMVADAMALQEAGIDLLVLECVPAELAAHLSESLEIPVIGIGAGAGCDGQVLVLYDILAITRGHRPKFSRDFMAGQPSIEAAIGSYVQAVKGGSFPGPEHTF